MIYLHICKKCSKFAADLINRFKMKTNGIMKRICMGMTMVLITLSLSVSLSMSVSAQGQFKDVRQTYLWDVTFR